MLNIKSKMQQTKENADRQERIRLQEFEARMELSSAKSRAEYTEEIIKEINEKIISNAWKNEETRFEDNKKLEEQIRKLSIELKEHKRNIKRLEILRENLREEFNNPRRVEGRHRHHHDERSRDHRQDDRRDNYRNGK